MSKTITEGFGVGSTNLEQPTHSNSRDEEIVI